MVILQKYSYKRNMYSITLDHTKKENKVGYYFQ